MVLLTVISSPSIGITRMWERLREALVLYLTCVMIGLGALTMLIIVPCVLGAMLLYRLADWLRECWRRPGR